MKRSTVPVTFAKPVLVTLIATLVAVALPALASDADVAHTISTLEYKWADAQKSGDAATVAPLLSETFVNTDADGETYGKARLLSNLKGGKWEHNQIADVKVTVYSDVAVATGHWAGKGVDGDGSKIDRKERWTDTWVKTKDGRWQCVASQQTSTNR